MNVSLLVIRMTTMIVSIGALGFTTYHTRLAQEEYYNPDRHGERPGQFIGAGAERLGLCGTVSQDQFTPIVLAGLAGLGVGYQQWASRHHARSDVPVYVQTSDFRPIKTLKLRPDPIIPSVPSTPAAPSIDALLQRLRNPSHDHKETER